MTTPTVSLCMILKNAESTVARAIESVRGLYDEVVVVLDDATTDGTAQVLEQFGARVTTKSWTGFADARNLAFDEARGKWAIILDGDEEFVNLGDLREKIAEAVLSEETDGVGVEVQSVIGDEGQKKRLGTRGDQIRVVRICDRIRWKFEIHNQLRGWRPHSILKSDAVLHAYYPASYEDRNERNEGRLLRYRQRHDKGSEEWMHATAYLCRGAAAVADHSSAIRYARESIEQSPKGSHPSVWSAYVGSMMKLDAPRERVLAVMDAALEAQPQNADVLYWKLSHEVRTTGMAWWRAVHDESNVAVDIWSSQFVDRFPEMCQMLGMRMVGTVEQHA